MKVLGKARSIRMVFKITIILLATFFLNYLFRQHLYNHSIVTILRIQKHETLTLNYFFNFLIDLCDSRLVGLIFVVSNIVAKDKNYILSLLMYFLGCIWVSIILKLLYGDPRPFWTSSVVKNLGDNCQFDYGNPFGSGISPILLF
jgi:Na+/H+ antiporter NhaB